MQELIKVKEENGEQLVSARELHEFLESKQDFTNWIKARIEKYGFLENEDFTIILSKSGGRPQSDYILKIDMAKELSMVEGNEKGSQARRYFLNCEKKLKEILPQLSEMEMIVKIANNQIAIEKKFVEMDNKIDSVINTVTLESGKQRKIQLAVSKRVYEILEDYLYLNMPKENFNEEKRNLFSGLYRDLKRKFGVASYKDIKVVEYENALEFIREWV